MAIDLRKLASHRATQPRVARVQRENITIPHYWIVQGVVITNLQNALEYKQAK